MFEQSWNKRAAAAAPLKGLRNKLALKLFPLIFPSLKLITVSNTFQIQLDE